jgi:hypothetical protein
LQQLQPAHRPTSTATVTTCTCISCCLQLYTTVECSKQAIYRQSCSHPSTPSCATQQHATHPHHAAPTGPLMDQPLKCGWAAHRITSSKAS